MKRLQREIGVKHAIRLAVREDVLARRESEHAVAIDSGAALLSISGL